MGHDQKLNQEARMRQERIKETQSFAQAVANGQVLPRDRFGVELTPGSMVLYRPNIDMIFKVEDVRPVLDPRMGPGVVTIVLSIQAPITVRVGQPLVSMIVVGVGQPPASEDIPQGGATEPEPVVGLHIVPPTNENPPSDE